MGSCVILICILHLVYFTQIDVSADSLKDPKDEIVVASAGNKDAALNKGDVESKKAVTKPRQKIEIKSNKEMLSSEHDPHLAPEMEKSADSENEKSHSSIHQSQHCSISSLRIVNYDAHYAMSSGSGENTKKKKNKSENEDDSHEDNKRARKGPEWQYFGAEQLAGEKSDLSHTNPKYKLTLHYDLHDLGRRADLEEGEDLDELAEDNLLRSVIDDEQEKKEVTPVKASPDFVLAMVNATKGRTNSSYSHLLDKQALRTSDYFDGVWQEDMNPIMLRTGEPETPITLEAVKVKIYEGTRLHEIVEELKKISPQLLYIINKQ